MQNRGYSRTLQGDTERTHKTQQRLNKDLRIKPGAVTPATPSQETINMRKWLRHDFYNLTSSVNANGSQVALKRVSGSLKWWTPTTSIHPGCFSICNKFKHLNMWYNLEDVSLVIQEHHQFSVRSSSKSFSPPNLLTAFGSWWKKRLFNIQICSLYYTRWTKQHDGHSVGCKRGKMLSVKLFNTTEKTPQ